MREQNRRPDNGGLGVIPFGPAGQIPVTQEMLDSAVMKKCGCGCDVFIPGIRVYVISPFAPGNPVGQELTAQQPVLVCSECKKVL